MTDSFLYEKVEIVRRLELTEVHDLFAVCNNKLWSWTDMSWENGKIYCIKLQWVCSRDFEAGNFKDKFLNFEFEVNFRENL